MTVFVIQSLLLLAVAFILGCLLGSFLSYAFAPAPQPAAAVATPAPAVSKPTPKKQAPKPRPKPTAVNKDNLQEIKGVGPVLEKKLNEIGVFRFDQIAAWTAQEVSDFNDKLSFSGRIERDAWLPQAAELAKKSDS